MESVEWRRSLAPQGRLRVTALQPLVGAGSGYADLVLWVEGREMGSTVGAERAMIGVNVDLAEGDQIWIPLVGLPLTQRRQSTAGVTSPRPLTYRGRGLVVAHWSFAGIELVAQAIEVTIR